MKKMIAWGLVLALFGCGNGNSPMAPPQSHLSWLQKVRDGVVFHETFENQNFITADGWTTLQGSPVQSLNQAKAGIASWDNAAVTPGTTTQSLPVAKKVIKDTAVDAYNTLFIGWFYDDASNITAQGPFLKVKTAEGKFIQVGVRNSVSTTTYCGNAFGVYTEDNFVSLGATRTTKWHQFAIFNPGQGQGITIYIDANQVYNDFNNDFSYITEIYVQANKVGGTGTSFGYFDEIGYYRNFKSQINCDPHGFNIYSSENVFLNGAAGSGGIPFYGFGAIQASVFPQPCFIEFSFGTSASEFLKIISRTPSTNLSPGDIYEFNDIDFGRKVKTADPIPTGLINRNVTSSGSQEVLSYGLKDRVTFSIQRLLGKTWRRLADNWFNNAVLGNPFSLMVDDSKENALGVIGDFSGGGMTPTVTILPNLGTNPTDAFTVTQEYVIRDAANSEKFSVQLVSKDTNHLTFDQNMAFDVNMGDYVYSKYYYPFMELGQADMSGFRFSDSSYLYYDWSQEIREYNS